MHTLLLALLFLVACGSEAPTSATVDAAPDAAPTMPDAGPVEAAPALPEAGSVDAPALALDAGHGMSSDADAGTCSPLAYTEPPTCACFFAGSCPYVDSGRAKDCLWSLTPMTVTGQPTCRGCGLVPFPPNPCNRCRETFTCECLRPYLSPGQKCCDGPSGPYLSDFGC